MRSSIFILISMSGKNRRCAIAERLSRQAARAQTRARLLAAAGQVFAERGFAGATVEDVAEAAGYTKGAVYYNFADKEELFLALMDERVDANLRAISTALERYGELDTVVTGLRAQSKQWCLLMTEFWLAAMRDAGIQTRLAARQARIHTHVVDLLRRRCTAEGITPRVPLEDVATVLLAVEDGLTRSWHLDPTLASGTLFTQFLALVPQIVQTGWPDPAARSTTGTTGESDDIKAPDAPGPSQIRSGPTMSAPVTPPQRT